MTLTPLEGRISTLRQEARRLVTHGGSTAEVESLAGDVGRLGDEMPEAFDVVGTAVARTYLLAAIAAGARDVGQMLLWLEQCAAHLASDRMARTEQKGGCFGVRP